MVSVEVDVVVEEDGWHMPPHDGHSRRLLGHSTVSTRKTMDATEASEDPATTGTARPAFTQQSWRSPWINCPIRSTESNAGPTVATILVFRPPVPP
jgi:hypothetical protein